MRGKNLKSWLSLSLLASAAAAIPQGAWAQVEELIVTTERRAESLQRVPVAVTAFSNVQLSQLQIHEAVDLLKRVPNLIGANNVGQSQNVGYFMRGVGNDESLLGFDPPIGTYVDDVFIPRQMLNNVAFLDPERVEVARGPQGQLHGRNTTGGAVKVFSVKPSEDFYARGSVRYGNYDDINVFGTVNGGLTDSLFAKITGFWEEDDGYQKNIVTGDRAANKDRWAIRGQLRFAPTDDLTIDLTAEHGRLDEIGALGAAWPRSGVPPVGPHAGSHINPNIITTPAMASSTFGKDFGTQGEETAFAMHINWDVGPVQIENIASHRLASIELTNEFLDPGHPGTDVLASLGLAGLIITPGVGSIASALPDGVFIIEQNSRARTISEELKGTSTFEFLGGTMDWVGGIYYLHERNRQFGSDFFTAFGLNTANRFFRYKTDSVAVYSQFDWEFVPDWTLIFAGRVTHDKKSVDVLYCLPICGVGDSFDSADVEALGITDLKLKQTEFDPKAGLEWQASENAMLYFTASNSFKPGGWSLRVDEAADFLNYMPEHVWSYEVGARTEWFDNRLRANLTLFRVKYKDLVTTSLAPGAAPGSSIFSLFNVGDAVVKGVEFEMVAAPFEGFDLFGSVGYQEGDIDTITGVPPTLHIKQKPDWTATFGANYRWPVYNAFDAFVGANAYWHSDYFIEQTNPVPLVKDKVIASAFVGFETQDGRLRVEAECKNCFDRTNIQWELFNRFYPDEPLRYGLRVTLQYN